MIREFQGKIPKIHESVFVAENAVIVGDIVIEKDANIWYNCVIRGDVNYIRIGEKTNIQDGTIIHVASIGGDFPTIIEEEVTVGHAAIIHACHVEKGCLIGMGAIILDGARIGKNSLVAAGSVVTPGTHIPERSLVMGNPGKVKRELTDAEINDLEKFWQGYVELNEIYRDSQ